jgi:hypothetical protein
VLLGLLSGTRRRFLRRIFGKPEYLVSLVLSGAKNIQRYINDLFGKI